MDLKWSLTKSGERVNQNGEAHISQIQILAEGLPTESFSRKPSDEEELQERMKYKKALC